MQCPGQDSRYWTGEAIFEAACDQCGGLVELFKDEATHTCRGCGHRVLNPRMDFGCAEYCPYATQCLGELPPSLVAKRQEAIRDRVAVEMKRYFGTDFRRIGHATRVTRHAEEIGRAIGANPAVVAIAGYLHDIGIHEAERRHGSTAARYQHLEGPPIARRILEGLGAAPGLVDEVCDIVGHHHHPRPEETRNFQAVYDADLIVNLEEKKAELGAGFRLPDLERIFLTGPGRELGRRILTDSEAGGRTVEA
ncbi:MAG: HD domain-containing protein [Thermodesulfobacteriota bacterium]